MKASLDIDHLDPKNISKEDMKNFANHIEEYCKQMKAIMIIPKELSEYEKDFNEGFKRAEELIKKLRKGDKSVFIDDD